MGVSLGYICRMAASSIREFDADLHFMGGCNQGRLLETEPDPDLLFKPTTIHGSILHEGLIDPLIHSEDPNSTGLASAPGDPRPTLEGEGSLRRTPSLPRSLVLSVASAHPPP